MCAVVAAREFSIRNYFLTDLHETMHAVAIGSLGSRFRAGALPRATVLETGDRVRYRRLQYRRLERYSIYCTRTATSIGTIKLCRARCAKQGVSRTLSARTSASIAQEARSLRCMAHMTNAI